MQNQFYGDRSGMIEDPYGHVWTIATHKEDIAPEEIDRRFAAAMQPHGDGSVQPDGKERHGYHRNALHRLRVRE